MATSSSAMTQPELPPLVFRISSPQVGLPLSSFTCCTSEDPQNSRNPSLVPSVIPAIPHTVLHSCECQDPESNASRSQVGSTRESRCLGEVHRLTQYDTATSGLVLNRKIQVPPSANQSVFWNKCAVLTDILLIFEEKSNISILKSNVVQSF